MEEIEHGYLSVASSKVARLIYLELFDCVCTESISFI